MLRFLNIENLAVIDSLQIEFRTGLNVLSGETGSGKSIIIDALGLLLGERGSADMIRTGSERAFVEGVFEVSGNAPLLDLLAESGIDLGDDDLILRRELGAGGRGRIFVNNRSASIGLLKAVQPHVIDLHGQGDQQSLLSPETHLNLLDAYATASQARLAVSQCYESLQKLVRELEVSRQSESERLQALDMVEFQIGEIEQANVTAQEDAELSLERNLLANAEQLARLSGEAYRYIYDDETSVLTRLGTVQRRLSDLAALDRRFNGQLEQLQAAKAMLDDIAFFLRDFADGIQSSPERLKYVEDRLAELERLKRKYGNSIEEVLSTYARLAERRESLLHSEERIKQLGEQLRELAAGYTREAAELSRMRNTAARKFERAVSKELSDVALGAGRFKVNLIEPAGGQISEKLEAMAGISAGAVRRYGQEQVEFYFSANPGEDLKPMHAVASGGELSRLMLVLKTITAPTLFPRTLIFDEIDSGIGGKVSDAVGQRLKRLAATNQVLCVTHQSQIARYADAHFQVNKEVIGGRTITGVRELDKEGRIDELARMIGGMEVTPVARKHARELLRSN